MPKKRLSDSAIAKLRHSSSGQYTDFRDIEVAGLGLRIRRTGTKSWYVQLRGKSERVFFGRWPELGVDEARDRAITTRRVYAGGQPTTHSVAELVRHYRSNHRSRRKGRSPDERPGIPTILDTLVEKFGELELANFGPTQTAEFIRPKAGLNATQNRWLTLVRSLWLYAEEIGWYSGASPTRGIKRRYERPRNRAALTEEIEALISALDQIATPSPRNAIVLAYETGARIGEVLRLRWDDIRPDWAERDGISVPAAILRETKSERDRAVPLSERALQCLAQQSSFSGGAPWVFPGFTLGKPLSWSACNNWMRRARDLAKVQDLTIHDLRHARGTQWLMQGIPVHIVSRVLGHANPSTTLNVYADASSRDAVMGVFFQEKPNASARVSTHRNALARHDGAPGAFAPTPHGGVLK